MPPLRTALRLVLQVGRYPGSQHLLNSSLTRQLLMKIYSPEPAEILLHVNYSVAHLEENHDAETRKVRHLSIR